jgi:hypothetical protein
MRRARHLIDQCHEIIRVAEVGYNFLTLWILSATARRSHRRSESRASVAGAPSDRAALCETDAGSLRTRRCAICVGIASVVSICTSDRHQ